MNFCTLTFKSKILLSLLSLIIMMIIVDIAINYYIDSKTTKSYFVTDKFSKIKHYKLNSKVPKDILFIGSSTTYFGIETNLFKKYNLDVYNLGMQAYQYEDYPSVLKNVIDTKPKKVIISLPVNRLYEDLRIAKHPSIEELKAYYTSDKYKFLQALFRWLVTKHSFNTYSEAIYTKLEVMYNHLTSLNNAKMKKKDYSDYKKKCKL